MIFIFAHYIWFWSIFQIVDLHCPASLPTMKKVERCPENSSEWKIMAKKKNCERHYQTCTNPSKFMYHCVVNPFLNETIEVCAPVAFITDPGCYALVQHKKNDDTTVGSDVITTRTGDDKSQKQNLAILIIVVVCVPLFFVACVTVGLYLQRKGDSQQMGNFCNSLDQHIHAKMVFCFQKKDKSKNIELSSALSQDECSSCFLGDRRENKELCSTLSQEESSSCFLGREETEMDETSRKSLEEARRNPTISSSKKKSHVHDEKD